MRRFLLPLALLALATPLLAVSEAVQENVDTARAALARGDGIAAEAELERALSAGATRPDVTVDMGEALIQQGERKKARDWLTSGQFAKGEEGRGWRLLGLLERLDGNLPAAGRALDKAIAAAPNDPLMWVEVGRLRYQGGEQRQALDAAQQALKVGPDNPRALEFQAQLLRDSAGHAAALPLFERALKAAPDDVALLAGYAASLGEMGRASDMLAVTRKILSLDPANAQAFYLQAALAARAGNIDLARAMLNRIGQRLDDVPSAMLLSGVLELEAGNANVAAQKLIPLANRQSANPRVQLLLARALFESGDYQQLFARYGRLAERGDASPYLLGILGRALEEQGDRAGAAWLLDRVAAANPPELLPLFERDPPGVLAPRWSDRQDDPAITVPYVRALLGAGDTDEARRVATRFKELRSGSAEAQGLMGDVEGLAGQPAAALQHYEDAGKIRLTDNLLLRSAIAIEKAGQGGQVSNLIFGYLAVAPGSRMAARIAANQALDRKDWGQARLLLESLRLRGGNRDGRLLTSLALAQLRSGDAKAALATAERASQITPASSFAATVRALVLAHSGGDKDLAGQLIAQARKTGGDQALLTEAEAKMR